MLPFALAIAAYAALSLLGVDPVVLKPLPVGILAVWVFVRGEDRAARVLAVALANDAVADAVIEWKFVAGLGLFLVGHLLRITAFTLDRPKLAPVRALPFLALVLGVGCVVVPGAGALGLPIAAYAVAIGAMGWRAAARVDGTTLRWLGLGGAVLYLASDTLLAVNRFLAPLPAPDLLILSTYWAAQALVARSMLPSGRSDGSPPP